MNKQTLKLIKNTFDNITATNEKVADTLDMFNDVLDFLKEKDLFNEFLIWRARR